MRKANKGYWIGYWAGFMLALGLNAFVLGPAMINWPFWGRLGLLTLVAVILVLGLAALGKLIGAKVAKR